MTATHYRSSKGLKPIAELPYSYLCNAIAKLEREGYNADRDDEVAAMLARKAELEAIQTDEHDAKLADAAAPAGIGHNASPEALDVIAAAVLAHTDTDPFPGLEVHISDLYVEAQAWADGTEIKNEAQAAEVDRLIDAIKDAIKLAENAREGEIAPLNEQIKAIRERWYPLIADTTKLKGSAIRAKTALLAVKTKWGDKLRAAQKAEADRLRAEALAKAREAVEVTKAAPDNLEVAESAEDLIRAAQGNLRQAKAVESAAPKGFRTVWVTHVADNRQAVLTMMKRYPQEFIDLAHKLAMQDVREGKRVIDGFTITETKVAA